MRRRTERNAARGRRRALEGLRGAVSVRSVMVLAIAAALGAGGAIVVERARSVDRSGQETSVAALLDGRRVANGRLTGAPFAEYSGPVRPRMRGGEGSVSGDAVGSRSAQSSERAANVLAEGVERPTGASLRAVGVLRLAEGRYRMASATLERAREVVPGDARIAADLAVALLEEAIAEDVPRLAARALAVADEAIALDPYVDEAWFTRAAALEHLWIGPAAVAAWYDYLGRDEASPWAIEARRRVCALERLADPSVRIDARRRFEIAIAGRDSASSAALVQEFPSEARRVGLDRLVRDWPEAVLEGNAEASSRIESDVRTAADALEDVQQDRFFRDAADSLSAPRPDTDRRQLAEALTTYDRGRQAFRRGEVQAATGLFGSANVQLTSLECNAVASLAAFDLSRCEIYGRDYDSVLRRLAAVWSEADHRGYRHLAARAWWVSGYVHAVRFDVAPALGQLGRALDGLEATGDIEGSAIVGLLLAETNHWCGLRDEAWGYGRRALAALSRLEASGQTSVGFSGIGILAGAYGEIGASSALLESSLAAAVEAGDDASAATALGLRALRHGRQSNRSASEADMSSSRAALSRIADPVLAERVGAEVELAEAELTVSTSPEHAVEMISHVLATFDDTRDRVRTVQCLRLRAAANAAGGHAESARRDLTGALDELEEQRRRVQGVERRATLGDEARQVFNLGIDLHFGLLSDPNGAFQLSERERNWDRNGVAAGSTLAPAELAKSVPQRETVLAYTTRSDVLWIWAVDRGGASLERVDVGASRLRESVERFRRGVELGDPAELAQLSDPIVEALWRPVEARIPKDATVIIVGDATIRSLPFGALVDSRTGRFLIERNAFATARSVADVSGRSASAIVSGGSALVLGDPDFEAGTYSGLTRLPGAADEARAVASLYEGASLLLGSEANLAALRTEARRAAIIHYAGHAVVADTEGRREAALLLSGGALAGPEISEMRLSGVRLVVLAACGTSANGAEVEGGIGSQSLADAFLDAGVAEVVASHWAVSDQATAELLVEFHRRLRVGESVAAALRGAVMENIGGPDGGGVSPRDWAAHAVVR